MALDATLGGAASNSYVTRAEADAYSAAGMHFDNATWTALDSTGKDEFLIKATYHIDRQRLKGAKNDTTLDGSGVPSQASHFPRGQDSDGGTSFIPIEIKEATYEQAIYLATLPAPVSSRLQRVKLGDIEEQYFDRGKGEDDLSGGRVATLGRESFALIAPFLVRGGNIVF